MSTWLDWNSDWLGTTQTALIQPFKQMACIQLTLLRKAESVIYSYLL